MKRERIADALLQPLVVVDHRERAHQARVAEHLGFDVGANPGRQRRDVHVVGRDLKLRMAGDRRADSAARRDGRRSRRASTIARPPQTLGRQRIREREPRWRGGDFDALRVEPMSVTSV